VSETILFYVNKLHLIIYVIGIQLYIFITSGIVNNLILCYNAYSNCREYTLPSRKMLSDLSLLF